MDFKFEEYIKLLSFQYCMSLGIKPGKYNNKNFYSELQNWVKERYKIGLKYKSFLDFLGKDITTSNTAEVDKGKYDTIVKSLDTRVITHLPYDSTNNQVLNYHFFPNSKNPGLLHYDFKKIVDVYSCPDDIKQFITQNPYFRTYLNGWDDLHNSGKYDIIVGMYGHIHDNDKEIKLKQLKELRNKLLLEYKVEYECDRDYYYATIYTNQDKVTKIKTR